MNSAATVGRNIKNLRTQKGWTQSDLAERLGVVRATVASWEVGRRVPEPDMLARIGQLFGVSVDRLLGVEPFVGGDESARAAQMVIVEAMMKDRPTKDLIYFLRGRQLTEEDVEAVKDLLEARRLRRQREAQEREKDQP